MKLIVGIPCFNSAATIADLVKQLLNEKFDAIYVLDDASTDDSLQTLEPYGDKINIIRGKKNLGPAGNRNRILKYVSDEDIIIFIDGDMQLMSRNIRKIIESLFNSNPHSAVIGGGIMTLNQRPMTYNYGLFTSRFKDALGISFEYLARLLHFKFLVAPLLPLARRFTNNLDIRFTKPRQHRTDWVSEGHCYIRASVFKQLGGFDEKLRYHEGKELMWRIRQEAWGVLFAPRLWTRHMELKVRDKNEAKLRKEYKPVVEQKISMMLKRYDEPDDPWAEENNNKKDL